MDDKQADMCRVCRSEGLMDKPLYHPCVCTGSIKYIHQECLVQWLKYSKKEYCELCKHRYTFTPIYAPDMPKRLPIQDIITGLLKSVGRAVRFWLHYTLVAIAWLGIVPLTACRIYRCLFTGSVSSLLTLPLDMLSTENLLSDCFQGCFVVTCTLCTFISLVWLREQILHGGGPDWLEQDLHLVMNPPQNANAAGNNVAPAAAGIVVVGDVNQDPGVVAADADDDDDLNADADAAAEGDAEDADDEDNGNNGAQDENNWNPMEWERAAEELTWERLLGLDGSLLFMEHVFWVVSLNTLFIMLFAFCPYHIGHFTIAGFKAQEMFTATKFEGLLTTLIGYVIIASSLALLHLATNVIYLKRSKRILGLCYIAIKVSLLVVMEIVLFPLICGWWLDICSLSMFDATLKDREHSFQVAPGTSMFIHWLVGMVYIFYFASFILLLREVLRPGILWFLRNLNDPDFNPIQEMIHLPVYRHVRRFLASMVVFGTIVLVMLWLPIQVIQRLFPQFLPFHVMLSSPDTPVSELSLELLLLQVVLPALLEQGHTRQWLKGVIRGWCIGVSWILDLRSYLLGDVALDDNVDAERANVDPAAAAADEEEQVAPPGDDDDDLNQDEADVDPEQALPPGVDDLNRSIDPVCDEHDRPPGVEVCDASTNTMNEEVAETTTTKIDEVSEALDLRVKNPGEEVRVLAEGIDEAVAGKSGEPVIKIDETAGEIGEPVVEIDGAAGESGEPVVEIDGTAGKIGEPVVEIDGTAGEIGEPVVEINEAAAGEVGEPVVEINEAAAGEIGEPVIELDDRVLDGIIYPNGDVVVEPPVPADNPLPLLNDAEPGVPPAPQPAPEENPPAPPPPPPRVNPPPPPPQGLGDAHQAMMQGGGPTGFQPYSRPTLFSLKLIILIAIMSLTLFLASLVLFVVPVFVGRRLMSFWTGEIRVHELYTAACGLYTCWVILRIALVLYTWIPQGWRVIFNKLMEWTLLVSKSLFIACVLIGVIPLLLGLIFELVIVIPIRVPLDQTPVFFPWQDWALGVLHAKIITAATLMGPHWRLKRVIEQVYNQGLRNLDLKYVVVELCLPVLIFLGLLLAIPYVVSKSILPAFGFAFEMQNLVQRRIYPFLLSVFLLVSFCVFQARQFKRLYEHIKNDKYLVGQRLVNYEKRQ